MDCHFNFYNYKKDVKKKDVIAKDVKKKDVIAKDVKKKDVIAKDVKKKDVTHSLIITECLASAQMPAWMK